MSMSRRRIGRRAGGFTLAEVLVAVMVFLIGIVGIISLFAAAAVLHKGARDKTLSALAIQEVITQIRLDLESGAQRDENGNLKDVSEGRVPGYDRYRYEAEFFETGMPDQSMVLARIVLTWREKGRVRGEEFDYVFRPGPAFSRTVAQFNESRSVIGGVERAAGPDAADSDEQ